MTTDQRIEAMRREMFLRNHAGMRFEDTRRHRWEDADGQVVEDFPAEMPLPERAQADLVRWGLARP